MVNPRLTRRHVLVGAVMGAAALVCQRSGRGASARGAAPAAAAGTVTIGGDLVVNRMGFGAMRITGPGIWGEPKDPLEARSVLRRAVELGVNFIDTADAYGPAVSERLIAEALHPYPSGLVIATKGGAVRPGPSEWESNGKPEHQLRHLLHKEAGVQLSPLACFIRFSRPWVVSPAVSSWRVAPYREVTKSIRLCRSSALNCLKRSRLAAP